jgi:LPS sulfotransferase NodH
MDTIDTGYEAQFDFPTRNQLPALCYLLASVPRSGSTLVSHLLWRTGCLGAPLEYLNFEPAGPYGFASDSPVKQLALWRNALTHRTSINGVFGLKAFPLQMEALHDSNPALLVEVMRTMVPGRGRARIVRLRRRDPIAHAISYARAALSGIWRSEQEIGGRPEPEYSERAVVNAGRLIEKQESSWDAMFRDLDLVPLEIWYEDVLADTAGTIRAVATHLGVTLDPTAVVEIPEIVRQSQRGADAWREAHGGRTV